MAKDFIKLSVEVSNEVCTAIFLDNVTVEPETVVDFFWEDIIEFLEGELGKENARIECIVAIEYTFDKKLFFGGKHPVESDDRELCEIINIELASKNDKSANREVTVIKEVANDLLDEDDLLADYNFTPDVG